MTSRVNLSLLIFRVFWSYHKFITLQLLLVWYFLRLGQVHIISSLHDFTGYISVHCIKNLSFPGVCTDSVGGTPYKMYLLSATSNMLWEWRCATTDDSSRWNSPSLWKKHARKVNSKLDMSDSSVYQSELYICNCVHI